MERERGASIVVGVGRSSDDPRDERYGHVPHAMNGDELGPGQYAVSTRNRNSEGRQGKRGRTFLASPLTAAAPAGTRTRPGSD